MCITKLEATGYSPNCLIKFKEDLDDNKQGSGELLNACKQYCKHEQSEPMIAIFDRDELDKVSQGHDESQGFKTWGNKVYSFALPIPDHRQGIKDICIKHYYNDDEIKIEDNDGRRLFLSNEFNPKSGRHLSLPNLSTRNQLKEGQVKIIDNHVFNEKHENVALSKNAFADYIFEGREGFDNFTFKEFKKVFEIIDKIAEVHEVI